MKRKSIWWYIDINLKVDGEIHRDLKAQQKLLSDYIHFTTTDTKSREVYKTMFDAKEVIVQLDHLAMEKELIVLTWKD